MSVVMTGVTKAYDGRVLLNAISCTFKDATATALIGPSGCGKSTLLNIALGLVKPDSGDVAATGVPSAVFQEDRLIERLSALSNVRLVCARDVGDDRILALLSELGLESDARKRVASFSGGMKRRVAIARALIVNPDLLALDEPFKGLDAQARQTAARCILQHCPSATILIATHDEEDVRLLGCRQIMRVGAAAHSTTSQDSKAIPPKDGILKGLVP